MSVPRCEDTTFAKLVKAAHPCAAIVEKFVVGPDGALVPLTEGSTRPIASTVTHTGIVKVRRYAFDLP